MIRRFDEYAGILSYVLESERHLLVQGIVKLFQIGRTSSWACYLALGLDSTTTFQRYKNVSAMKKISPSLVPTTFTLTHPYVNRSTTIFSN